jgi:hypothetical protein
MTTTKEAIRKDATRWLPIGARAAVLLATTLAVGGMRMPAAHAANQNLYFQGGPMKNLSIDLVFWGINITAQQQADVRDYVVNFSQLVNGGFAPQGQELAVHYYGVWGVLPGNTIVDTHPVPACLLNHTCDLSDSTSKSEIAAAKAGAFGASRDQFGNLDAAGLPSGTERIAILVVQGIQAQDGSGSTDLCAYHQYAGTPYAVVMLGCDTFQDNISHEVFESMTDTTPWSGWVTNQGFGNLTHFEGADQCNGAPDAPTFIGSSGDNITGVTDFNMNSAQTGVTADSCILFEPEQYAPIAATMSPTSNDVYYRTPQGFLSETAWNISTNTHGTISFGAPSASVTLQGKPTAVNSAATDFVFVRGSDNALWQLHNWTWTSLGGVIIGDPSAVVWNNGNNINVFALGSDNTLFTFEIVSGAPQGWAQVPGLAGRAFSGPPRAFSKSATTIDVFGVGQNGHLEWIPFSTASGWGGITDLGTVFGAPHHAPVGIASWATNRLDLFVTTEVGNGHRGWNGSWASDYDSRPELGTYAAGTTATVSWASNRLDAFQIDRFNRLEHVFYDGSWHADGANPMATDATGDPVVISRGVGKLDVYYRGTDGSLRHRSFNGSWTNEGSVTAANAIH